MSGVWRHPLLQILKRSKFFAAFVLLNVFALLAYVHYAIDRTTVSSLQLQTNASMAVRRVPTSQHILSAAKTHALWVPIAGTSLYLFQPSKGQVMGDADRICRLESVDGHFIPPYLRQLYGDSLTDEIERRVFGEAFSPITVAYKEAFRLCAIGIWDGKDQTSFITNFLSAHNDGSEHDCDALPYLQELAVGKGNTGVAVDVGASDGVSAWLLLAHGHYVHLFEPSINRESRRIMSNIELNGWEAQVSLHGTVVVRPPGKRLDRNLAHEAHIGVLKIDVDGNELTVIESAKGLLPRTSIVQVSKQTNEFT